MISSLVSYARVPVFETLPGMQIATYNIPPCEDDENPRILHVSDSYYIKHDIDANPEKFFVPSQQIVESIQHMFKTSQMLYGPDAHPALMAFPEVKMTPEMLTQDPYVKVVVSTLRKQRVWYSRLLEMADNDYQQFKRPQVVSHLQRIAAKELGQKRDWLVDYIDEVVKPECSFCGTGLINPSAPMCPNCKEIINPEAYMALKARIENSFAKEEISNA